MYAAGNLARGYETSRPVRYTTKILCGRQCSNCCAVVHQAKCILCDRPWIFAQRCCIISRITTVLVYISITWCSCMRMLWRCSLFSVAQGWPPEFLIWISFSRRYLPLQFLRTLPSSAACIAYRTGGLSLHCCQSQLRSCSLGLEIT